MGKNRAGRGPGGKAPKGKTATIIGVKPRAEKGVSSAVKEKMKKKKIAKSIEKKKEKRKEEERVQEKRENKKKPDLKRKRPEHKPLALAPGLDLVKAREFAAKKGTKQTKPAPKDPKSKNGSSASKSKDSANASKPKDSARASKGGSKKDSGDDDDPVPLTPRERIDAAKKRRFEKDPRLGIIDQAKSLWEKAREKSLSGEERRPLIDKLHDLMTEHYCEIILKHDASRIVQTVVKFGTSTQKESIVREIRPAFLNIIKSTYGSFLIKKILRYVHNTVRQEIFEKDMRTHFPVLFLHSHAFRAIETMFELGQAKQRALILDEFYDQEYTSLKPPEPVKLNDLLSESAEKKAKVLASLKKFIERFINKISERGEEEPSAMGPKKISMLAMTLLHHLILDYLSNASDQERADMIGMVRDYLIHMAHTRPGHRLSCLCVAYGTAGDRKAIARSLKGHVVGAATEDMGHRFLISLLCFTDDTILLRKSILEELNADMKDVLYHPLGHLSYLVALAGRGAKGLPPYTKELLSPVSVERNGELKSTSLKSDDQRHQELRAACGIKLIDFISQNVLDVLRNPSSCRILMTLLETTDKAEDRARLYEAIIDLVPSLPPQDDLQSILEEIGPSRAIKKIVKLSDDLDSGSEFKFGEALMAKIKKHLSQWAVRKGSSFVVVSLLESKLTGGAAKSELAKSKKALQGSQEAGAKIILGLLR